MSGPTKVVYINTQYVEIDALNFKSVVQNLTGKDSVIPPSPPPPSAPMDSRSSYHSNGRKINNKTTDFLKETPTSSENDCQYYRHQRDQDLQSCCQPVAAGDYDYSKTRQNSSSQVMMMERGNSFLMRDMSFKDIDRLLKELPALDELHGLFSDYPHQT